MQPMIKRGAIIFVAMSWFTFLAFTGVPKPWDRRMIESGWGVLAFVIASFLLQLVVVKVAHYFVLRKRRLQSPDG